MKFEIVANMKKDDSFDGVYYCAQRIEEMLMRYTSHLYRTPVYNSFYLVMEYIKVSVAVEKDSIDKSHLKNIIEEFSDTFSADPVIREHFTKEQIEYFVGRVKGTSIPDQKRTMEYLWNVLSDYPEWCEESLRNAIQRPKEKKKINSVLKSYLPLLIGQDYHPQFVYSECKRVFSNKLADYKVFETFLKRFDGTKHEYDVYFLVEDRVSAFQSILENRLEISFEQDKFSSKLLKKYAEKNSNINGKQICLHVSLKALDANGAAGKAYETLLMFVRFYKFFGNRDEEICWNRCIVKETKSSSFVNVEFGGERYYYYKDFDDKALGENSERVITKLLENVGRYGDYLKIVRIIQSHNVAIASRDARRAFLNLWSVLEIVGVNGYGRETSKIQQILKNLIPVLQRNYVKNLIGEICEYITDNIPEEEYDKTLSKIKEEGSKEYKVACLVSLDVYEELRGEICAKLVGFPLIRSRIRVLYEDFFKKKKNLWQRLEKYGQRLNWHIQRLYRVRNEIIHSGENNAYMGVLVEHLHSYVDEIIHEVIGRITSEKSLGTVANVLLDAQVFVERIQKECKKDGALSPESLMELLQ